MNLIANEREWNGAPQFSTHGIEFDYLQAEAFALRGIELPFESAAGRPIFLEMKPELPLGGGPWTILAITNSPTVRGAFLDPAASEPQRYYRLRLEP